MWRIKINVYKFRLNINVKNYNLYARKIMEWLCSCLTDEVKLCSEIQIKMLNSFDVKSSMTHLSDVYIDDFIHTFNTKVGINTEI